MATPDSKVAEKEKVVIWAIICEGLPINSTVVPAGYGVIVAFCLIIFLIMVLVKKGKATHWHIGKREESI